LYFFNQLGAEKMVLAVKADNFSAIRLYEAMGYIEEGRLKREIKLGLEYIDLILMAKMLV
jgi:RimJ/RimL family protein N-acetyltransferase